MARPVKLRKIDHVPAVPYYVPSDKEAEGIENNILLVEELEAIRLKDYEGLEQEECAQKMEVSRPTFQRILLSAREKIADSLITGKAIHIAGGNYTRNICSVICDDCHSEWKESFENMQKVRSGNYTCPNCGSRRVECARRCREGFCQKHCRKQTSDGCTPQIK